MDKLSWKVPVYAFPAIYLFGFGLSFSNHNDREFVELCGIALFLISALLGIVFASAAITKDRRIHWHASLEDQMLEDQMGTLPFFCLPCPAGWSGLALVLC